jgi:hypothetical protein
MVKSFEKLQVQPLCQLFSEYLRKVGKSDSYISTYQIYKWGFDDPTLSPGHKEALLDNHLRVALFDNTSYQVEG